MIIIDLFIKIGILFISVILIVYSCTRLYRWRKSAFSSTNAYLKNQRYYSIGEKACIQAPDEQGLEYRCSGKDLNAHVYYEYHYTVDGRHYCKSYFNEADDDGLPSKIKMHYNKRKPQLAFRDGAVRENSVVSLLLITLGVILLFGSIASLI